MPHTDSNPGTDQRRVHQPDEDRFRVIRSEEVEWKAFASFPPAARLAVLVGDPSQPGPYLIRVRLPAGTRMMPHKHAEDRLYGTAHFHWARSGEYVTQVSAIGPLGLTYIDSANDPRNSATPRQ